MTEQGTMDLAALDELVEPAVLVVQQPNFFGQLEPVDALTDWAAARGVLVIAVVNPLTLAVLKPPGEWGSNGVDIACGDGQPLGIPMASGGPSFGFITCRQSLVRQMPGRLIGRTEDLEGRTGFTLTLQAREQHIRRGKATSNICTNQGLLVTAATIHMSLLGPEGLRRAAAASHANTRALVQRLTAIDGVGERFAGAFFHERVLTLPRPAAEVVEDLLGHGIIGGLALSGNYPGFEHELLVCATEKRTAAEIETYGRALEACL
jgi:glycine dehydrogenase subunit 1